MAQKAEDLFRSAGSNSVVVTVGDIKTGVKTKFGVRSIVSVIYAGSDYDFWMDNPPAGVTGGDNVQVTMNPPKGTSKYSSYSFSKTGDSPSAPMAGKIEEGKAATTNDYAKDKDVLQNRISIAGYLQAIINSGKYSDMNAAKQMAVELVEWSKAESERMYDEEHANI